MYVADNRGIAARKPNTEGKVDREQIGHIDHVHGQVITGWAYDGLCPEEPATVAFFIDGIWAGEACGTLFREDLMVLGKKNGRLAFEFPIPEYFCDAAEHTAVARFASGQPLHGTATFCLPKPGNQGSAAALAGKEGWLYLCGDSNESIALYRGEHAISAQALEQYRSVFAQRASWFAQQGIPHLFFIIPGKEYLYPEYLPDGIAPSPAGNIASQIIRHQEACGGLVPVYLLEALAARKSHGRLCYLHDSHWNYLGSFFGAQAILRHTQPYLPQSIAIPAFEEYDLHEAPPIMYDLLKKDRMEWKENRLVAATHSGDFQSAPPDFILKPKKPAKARRVPTPSHVQISKTRSTIVYETDDAALPCALFLGDSYMSWMMPYLAESFRRSVFMWQSDLDEAPVTQERPDIVIQCRVDRFMIRPPER